MEYLIIAIQNIYPELKVNIDGLREIINNRIARLTLRSWGGVVEGAFSEYSRSHVPENELPKYKVEKTILASLLAKEMIEKGIPEQIEKALNRVLNLAEGRVQYE